MWYRVLDKIFDISIEMLEIASKRIPDESFQFLVGDAHNPPISVPRFTGGMSNFWFSHIPKKQITKFFLSFHSRVNLGSPIMFVDAVYRQELGGKLIKKKGSQDTWKERTLDSGEKFDILKNYYTKEELIDIFSSYSKNISVSYLTHFWIVQYKLSTYKKILWP